MVRRLVALGTALVVLGTASTSEARRVAPPDDIANADDAEGVEDVEAPDAEASEEETPAAAPWEEGVARGQAKLDLGEPDAAVELWSEAYEQIPPTDEHREARTDVMLRLASAHAMAFDIAGDPQRLEQAIVMLETYSGTLESGDARVDARIEELKAKRPGATPEPPPPEAMPPQTELDAPPSDPKADAMKKGGIISLALGGTMLVMTITFGVLRKKAKDDLDAGDVNGPSSRLSKMNTYQAAGKGVLITLVLAGAFVTTGVGLLVGARVHRKKNVTAGLIPGGIALKGSF